MQSIHFWFYFLTPSSPTHVILASQCKCRNLLAQLWRLEISAPRVVWLLLNQVFCPLIWPLRRTRDWKCCCEAEKLTEGEFVHSARNQEFNIWTSSLCFDYRITSPTSLFYHRITQINWMINFDNYCPAATSTLVPVKWVTEFKLEICSSCTCQSII